MGLSLGIENLTTKREVEEVEVSNEQLLRSTLVASVNENHMDKAFSELHELLRNAANYTEILSSLQKHSSLECYAYASDLLNQTIASEEDVKERITSAIKTAGTKISEAAKKAADTMRSWLTSLVDLCRDLISKVKGLFRKKEAATATQANQNTTAQNTTATAEKKETKAARTVGSNDDDARLREQEAIRDEESKRLEKMPRKRTIGSNDDAARLREEEAMRDEDMQKIELRPVKATLDLATDIMQSMINNGFNKPNEMSKLAQVARSTSKAAIGKADIISYLVAAKDVFMTGARWIGRALSQLADSLKLKALLAVLGSFFKSVKNGVISAFKWVFKRNKSAAKVEGVQ